MVFDFHTIDVLVILTLSLTKFSVGFITGMVIPIFPSLISMHFNDSSSLETNFNSSASNSTNSSFNYQQLSILFAAKNVGQIVTSPLMGYFCGLVGSLNVLLFGVISQIVTVLFYGLGNKYYLLIIGRLFESIANAAINCAVSSFVAYRYAGHKKRGLVYGIGGLGLCFGGASGPAFGGWVFQYYGKVIVFLSVLSLMGVELVLLISLLIFERKKKDDKLMEVDKSVCDEVERCVTLSLENVFDIPLTTNITKSGDLQTQKTDFQDESKIQTSLIKHDEDQVVVEKPPKHNILNFFLDPYFLISLGAFPVIFISLFIYFATLPHYMKVRFGATESQQGAIWLLNLFGYILGFLFGNFLNTKLAKCRHIVLMGSIYLHSLGVICMPLMPTWWAVAIPLCFIVNQHLIFEIVLAPLLATIIEKKHQSKFGLMSGIIMMVIAFTSSLGSFLGPILFSCIGFWNLNIIVFAMGILYGPLLLFLKKFM